MRSVGGELGMSCTCLWKEVVPSCRCVQAAGCGAPVPGAVCACKAGVVRAVQAAPTVAMPSFHQFQPDQHAGGGGEEGSPRACRHSGEGVPAAHVGCGVCVCGRQEPGEAW